MDAKAIIEKIRTAEKKTPVKAYIRTTRPLHFENCHVFTGADMIVMGDYKDIAPVLERNEDAIEDLVVECDRRNSALPLADIKTLHARIEPGAIIRDEVEIGEGAVIMMGAILNIGTAVGEEEDLPRVDLIKGRTEGFCRFDYLHIFGALGLSPILAVFRRQDRFVSLAVRDEVRQKALDPDPLRDKSRIIITYHRKMVNMYV